MQTFICLLRGINVSGKNLIKMDALKQLFLNLGHQNVVTYIQSGNVIFTSKSTDVLKLQSEIHDKINEDFDLNIPILIIPKQELESALANNIFVNNRSEDITKLHITFMSQLPLAIDKAKILEGNYGEDEFVIIDKCIYLFCPNGYGNTKLTNTFFEKKLKVSCTTRNWKTTNELLRLANLAC
ncbi:MAG: DUF1697 domain-containing protein [Bacteroidia bacterium]